MGSELGSSQCLLEWLEGGDGEAQGGVDLT